MRPTKILLLVLWLACSQCVAQIHSSAETRYRVDGIDGFELVAGTVLAPEGSKPSIVPVGLVSVESKAGIVRIKAEDKNRSPIETQAIADGKFLVLGSGKLWITVTCVDFDLKIFEQEDFTIVVGPDPVPEPDPDEPDQPEPDDDSEIPEDPFDNLGRRIDAAADKANLQWDVRKRVAEIYLSIAEKMEASPRQILRTSDAVVELTTRVSGQRLGPEWKPVFDVASRDVSERSALGWDQTIAWYRAVGAGIGG